MKRIAVLGSTGSIGTQTLDVAKQHPDRLKVVALAAAKQVDLLQQQAQDLGVRKVALFDENVAARAGVPGGLQALVDLATDSEVDCVVVSVAGVIGLVPTLEAIKAGKQIALASKEVLVAAGEIVMPLASKHGVDILPIDSEHSAIFQCLRGYRPDQVERLVLTASGGPFFGRTLAELEGVTREQALNHPTWAMGGKITIDSATLMNKGLETIEARWLFDVPVSKIDVAVHPQSIVHSLAILKDGSALAQMGWPDMRLPIQVALLHPERITSGLRSWNPVLSPNLTFAEPDVETFKCLALARKAAEMGGLAPCALNAANEEAANAFLRGECSFLGIGDCVEHVLHTAPQGTPTLESVLDTDRRARSLAREWMLAHR